VFPSQVGRGNGTPNASGGAGRTEMPENSPDDSLIRYPSAFPIKVMGAHVDGFVEAVVEIARRSDPGFDPACIERRSSRAGNYLGLTLTVTATSRAQLDDLYRALSGHPMVKMVL
jgi:putative lipoic acid-binding regulatory protein